MFKDFHVFSGADKREQDHTVVRKLRDLAPLLKSPEDFRFRLGLSMDAIVKITPYVAVISMSTKPAGGAATRTGAVASST